MTVRTPDTDGSTTHILPAGWRRVYDGESHKLEKRSADLEIEIADHCVAVAGDGLDRQGWQVDDPETAAVHLAWGLERSDVVSSHDQDGRPLLADGRGEATDEDVREAIEAMEDARDDSDENGGDS